MADSLSWVVTRCIDITQSQGFFFWFNSLGTCNSISSKNYGHWLCPEKFIVIVLYYYNQGEVMNAQEIGMSEPYKTEHFLHLAKTHPPNIQTPFFFQAFNLSKNAFPQTITTSYSVKLLPYLSQPR